MKVATDWPQFNWIIYHSCFRPDFWSLQALLDIQNAPGSMAPTTLTDSDGHTVPNIRWSTQFAQICGGKYVAGAEPTSTSPSSHHPLRNVYTELGTTMASMIVTFPTAWAHLIGQQLYYMGSEHIVFGSDSLWYGGPQWQVEALWRFQIPDDIAERWGYPQLTEYDKRQILGLNSARLYGLYGRQAVGVGEPGSPYRQGNLARYAPLMQPGSAIDTVLEGVGYPTPITPVDSGRLPVGRPDPERQLHQAQEAAHRGGRRAQQRPLGLDAHAVGRRRRGTRVRTRSRGASSRPGGSAPFMVRWPICAPGSILPPRSCECVLFRRAIPV